MVLKPDGGSHQVTPQHHVAQQGSSACLQCPDGRASVVYNFDAGNPMGQRSEHVSSPSSQFTSCHIPESNIGSFDDTFSELGPVNNSLVATPCDGLHQMTLGEDSSLAATPARGEMNPSAVVANQTFTESKGSSLDNKNNLSEETDIYANSDYTDTVSSVDSHTFLLPEKRTEDDAEDDTADKKNSLTATAVASQDNAAFYKNPAFAEEFGTEHAENCIEFSSAPQGDLLNNVTINRCSDTCLESCIRHQCVEEVNAVSDLKERAYPSETAILVENTAVAELVELLKEQCPSECVDIQVQELHEPVYQPLTEPVDKQGWMNSTESLHQYKLLKQGRSHLVPGEHDHSSFRSLAAESLSSLSRACQVALVHIRTDMEFGSMLSIEDHAKCPDQDKGFLPSELESLKKEGQQKSGPAVQSGRHKRNMIFMSILVTLVFISLNSARNLQSSINHEGGVGVTSLAAYFILYTLGSLVSPVVVKGLGVRLPVLVGLVVQLAHIGANLYPAMWLMVLSSGAGGFTVALMWNAMSTYIVLLARGEAEVKRLTYERVSDKYFGFFSFIFQFNLMVGSVISSLVLTFGNQAGAGTAAVALANMSISNLSDANVQHVVPPAAVVENGSVSSSVADCDNTTDSVTVLNATKGSHLSVCGAEFCHLLAVSQESSVVSDETKYLLFGTFMLIIVVAFLIGAFLMEPLRPHLLSPSSAPLKMVKQQLVSLARFSRNPKFLLLTPMLLYFSMQFNFICSDVMMVSGNSCLSLGYGLARSLLGRKRDLSFYSGLSYEYTLSQLRFLVFVC